jgi:hypothetical protein
LYRKVNTRTHHVRHASDAGEARWERNTKAGLQDERMRRSMHPGQRHGLDYTPLFRFLLSRVGQDWTAVRSEAAARLDSEEPIFWLVAQGPEEERDVVRIGYSSFWSGLKVDEANRLARVAPGLSLDDMVPYCACCTHTLNGERFTRGFDPDAL